MGPTSPLSVGGGVFELGFSARSGLFSCPGLLEEWSPSAFCVPSRVCAWALSPANAAAAKAAEPIPRTLLLETPSCIILSFFSSLIAFSSSMVNSNNVRTLYPGTSKGKYNPHSASKLIERCTACRDARPISSSADKTRQFFQIAPEEPPSTVSGSSWYVKLDHLCHD